MTQAQITLKSSVANIDWEARMKPQRSLKEIVGRRFLKHRPAVASSIIILLIALGCIVWPWAVGYDQSKTDTSKIRQAPSMQHIFGTDELGRDLLTRMWDGGRVSMLIGLIAMAIGISMGTMVGSLAGFYGGWTDTLLMRFADFMLSIPGLFLQLIFAQILRSTNSPVSGTWIPIVIIIGMLSWMGVSRLVRGQFLSLKQKEFVEAARMSGSHNGRIILRHILPNAASPIIVAATLAIGNAIIAESTLSFLGFGIQPPAATWGNMLRNAQSQMTYAPWVAIFPGLGIFITVMAINYIGDGLRDALDPRHVE